MFRHFLFLFTLFIFSSCSFFIGNKDLIRHNYWDSLNIPDSRKTGANENTDFSKLTSSGFIGKNVHLLLRTDTAVPFYCLTSYGQNLLNLPDMSVIRNWDFSDYDFAAYNTDRYPCTKKIVFENCKFKGFRNDSVKKGESHIVFVFNHCTFKGNISSSFIYLNDCKIGGFTSDAMNPLNEFYAKNVYVHDLLTVPSEGELHIDGIQIYGDQRSRNNDWKPTVQTGNIRFENIRFEIPSIRLAEENRAYVNACVMFQLEFSDVNNVSFEKLYVNGGGKWYPLYMDYGKNVQYSKNKITWSHDNLFMKHGFVSNNFDAIFYPSLLADAKIQNVSHHDYIFITSAWKDEKGDAHILVTNDTSSKKDFVVKSNKGTCRFSIKRCPSNWNLGGEYWTRIGETQENLVDEEGKLYTTYTFSDMPFDVEYIIPGNPDFLLCYQADEQIRYINFDGRPHYYSQIKEKKLN